MLQPTATRWVGTGRVVYDNKGNPVKAYEPFFDSSPVYDDETDLVDWGVTAITRYDPLGRAIRVDNPDGTYRTVEFDPWPRSTSDENDTVLASDWYAGAAAPTSSAPTEADAAAKAAAARRHPGHVRPRHPRPGLPHRRRQRRRRPVPDPARPRHPGHGRSRRPTR